jgi:hypothetical protein
MSTNPLRDSLIKDIVEPAIQASRKAFLGEVMCVDEMAGTIDVKPYGSNIVESSGDSLMSEDFIEKVSFLNSLSFKDMKPQTGDKVYIDFINNDMSRPVLLNIIREVSSEMFDTGQSLLPSSVDQTGISSKSDGAVNLGGGGRAL